MYALFLEFCGFQWFIIVVVFSLWFLDVLDMLCGCF